MNKTKNRIGIALLFMVTTLLPIGTKAEPVQTSQTQDYPTYEQLVAEQIRRAETQTQTTPNQPTTNTQQNPAHSTRTTTPRPQATPNSPLPAIHKPIVREEEIAPQTNTRTVEASLNQGQRQQVTTPKPVTQATIPATKIQQATQPQAPSSNQRIEAARQLYLQALSSLTSNTDEYVIILDKVCEGNLLTSFSIFDPYSEEQPETKTSYSRNLTHCIKQFQSALLPGNHAFWIAGLTTNTGESSQLKSNNKVGRERAQIAARALQQTLQGQGIKANITQITWDAQHPELESQTEVKGVRIILYQPASSKIANDPTAQVLLAKLKALEKVRQARDTYLEMRMNQNADTLSASVKALTARVENNAQVTISTGNKLDRDTKIYIALATIAMLTIIITGFFLNRDLRKRSNIQNESPSPEMLMWQSAMEHIRHENLQGLVPDHISQLRHIKGQTIGSESYIKITFPDPPNDESAALEPQIQPAVYTVKLSLQENGDLQSEFVDLKTGEKIRGVKAHITFEIRRIFYTAFQNNKDGQNARNQISRLLKKGTDLQIQANC